MLRTTASLFVVFMLLLETGPAAAAGFDGKWRVVANGDSGCYARKTTWIMTITGNAITGKAPQDHSRNGSVTSSGDFRIRGPNQANTGRDVVYTGKLASRTGRGTYHVVFGSCNGTLTLTKQ